MSDNSRRLRSTAYGLAYAASLPRLQEVAREHGYALAAHGSMATDFDLIAAPWTKDATDAETLIEALRESVNGVIRDESRWLHNPETKPHGRLAWSIYPRPADPHAAFDFEPYLDVSVMPRRFPTSESVRWVRQKHLIGCVVAALAMIAGEEYDAIHADFPETNDESGANIFEAEEYLMDRGYAIRRKRMFRTKERRRSPWPPEPFGDVHLCEVRVRKESSCNHAVVLLKDGIVLDPETPDPKRLDDYHEVFGVAAVHTPR